MNLSRKTKRLGRDPVGTPRWQNALAAPANALAVLFFGRERRPSRSALKNSAASLGWVAVNWCMVPVIYWALELTRSLYALLSIQTLPASAWEGVPWPLLLLISLAVKDFADYWNHRLMHTRWIWPIHAVHHSDTHVNFLTSFRLHFLEAIFMGISYVILLTCLGIPPIIGATGAMLLTLHNGYVHIDMDFGHGPFKYLLTSPRLHRWHHADHPKALGKNLANLFPFYDVLFGTYYLPGRCDEPVGARSAQVPPFALLNQFALPFVLWLKMASARLPFGAIPGARRSAANRDRL
jgi:sterol desaturase/sphingolipid hydroxylase (fatty acid hydroxylase superfamily)